MPVKLSVRREKAHLELLQSYGNLDHSHLYRAGKRVKDEMQSLVLEMASELAVHYLRLKHRVRLRRLADRHKMIQACQHVLDEGNDFYTDHPEFDHYQDMLDYTQFAIGRLTELTDENQRTVEVPRILQRISG